MKIETRLKIFKIGFSISSFLDSLIFDKLQIQLNHSYTRKKYMPCEEYWIDTLRDYPESKKYDTFLYVLFDYDKVVLQTSFRGYDTQEEIDRATSTWYGIVENYVDQNLVFTMTEWWSNYFKKHLSPFKDKPLQIQSSKGKWYKCEEVDSL